MPVRCVVRNGWRSQELNGPWSPLSRHVLKTRLRAISSPPPKPSFALMPARGPTDLFRRVSRKKSGTPARAVEEDVALDLRRGGLGLDVERRLLLVEADLARGAAPDRRADGVLAVRAVDARGGPVLVDHARAAGVRRRLVRVAPGRDGVAPDEGKIRVDDRRAAVVAADHDRVAVEAVEGALLEGHALRALEEDGGDAVEGPVARARDAVRVHVRVARGRERHALVLHVAHGVPLRARHVEEHALLRRDDLGVARRRARAVVDEVELLRLLVEEELVRVVELLEDVLDEEVAAVVGAARALVAAPAEGVVAVAVGRDLEHPVGPARGAPDEEERVARVRVGRVR